MLLTTILGSCAHQTVDLTDAHRLPTPEEIVFPVPGAVSAAPDTVTEMAMQNVAFHVDDNVRLGVRRLRGRMRATNGSHIVMLDDKTKLELDMASSEIALTAKNLSVILNRYVFGFKGSPLKGLVVRTEGDHIVQTGTMHKLIDIPFEITAALSVSEEGWIRIHPTRIKICGLDGEKLLKVVGSSLQALLDLSGGKGVKAVGNDLLINPLASLPPPTIVGTLTSIRVEGDDIVQDFGELNAPGSAPLTPPVAAANYIYFKGGTLQLGKLYMVSADLMAIDADPSDPFDFYLDYYHTQLVAGYHITRPNDGLVVYMPDFDDIGTPKGKVAAPAQAGR